MRNPDRRRPAQNGTVTFNLCQRLRPSLTRIQSQNKRQQGPILIGKPAEPRQAAKDKPPPMTNPHAPAPDCKFVFEDEHAPK